MDRREFLHTAAATAASLALGGAGASGGEDVAIARLATRLDRATRLEQASQYGALEVLLPGLVFDVEQAAAQDLASAGLLSRSHALRAWLLIKRDRPADAQVAAADALTVAERIGDPVLAGAAMRCLGEVHMRAGRFQLACDLAVEAAEVVRRPAAASDDALAIRGAGYLSAAMASARAGEGDGAAEMIRAAEACATQLWP